MEFEMDNDHNHTIKHAYLKIVVWPAAVADIALNAQSVTAAACSDETFRITMHECSSELQF